jgi:tetratricopeptide (TPR) repeat protein
LTELDIWFQIGNLYEQQKMFLKAKETYEQILKESPKHAKVLQKLGWLHHIQSNITDQDTAVAFLTKSVDAGQFY